MKPSTARVLERLRQGPSTTHELCQPDVGGIRFGARIKELRNEEGCEIECRRLSATSNLYTLVAEPLPTSPATLSPAGEPPAPHAPHMAARATTSQTAGVPGRLGQARAAGGTANSERNVAVEKPQPPVRLIVSRNAIDDDWDWAA